MGSRYSPLRVLPIMRWCSPRERLLCLRPLGGDVCGSVMFLQNKESDRPGDAEQKLIQAAASYLGKQMEL